MSQQTTPTTASNAKPPKGKGIAISALVLGTLALIFSWIPFVNIVGIICGLVGLVLGIVGIFVSRRTMSVVGTLLALVGIVLAFTVTGSAANSINDEANRVAKLHYEVTGDATSATVTYSTFGDAANTNQETNVSLPWTKDLETSGLGKGGTLTVTAGPDGGTVTCKVVVDGQDAKTGEASGSFATASCSGF